MATALRAGLSPGPELMAKVTGLDRALAQADVVVAGEDPLDHTRLNGTVIGEVYRRAMSAGRPVHALVGHATASTDRFDSVHQISEVSSLAFDGAAQELCAHIAALQ